MPDELTDDEWPAILIGQVVMVEIGDDLLILTYSDGHRVIIKGDSLAVGEDCVPEC